MESVAGGVHQVGGYVNAYIVDGDQGVVLIDTGVPKRAGPITNGLTSIGRAPRDIVAIILTHAHYDHTGGAAHLKKTSGATVIASRVDRPAIEGDEPMPRPPMIPGWLGWVTRLMPSAPPVDVDIAVSEDDQPDLPEDFTVVDTPGHTPGHISLLLDRDGGIAFVGDAAATNKGGSVSRGFFNGSGSREIDASIAHLGQQEFETAFFGHSDPIQTGAAAAFRAYTT